LSALHAGQEAIFNARFVNVDTTSKKRNQRIIGWNIMILAREDVKESEEVKKLLKTDYGKFKLLKLKAGISAKRRML
jgi:hypothetical protein